MNLKIIIKEKISYFINISKNCFLLIYRIFLWLLPVSFFILIILIIPSFLWGIDSNNYLNFIKILIWPVTVLTILFFFRKIFTYMFFSLDKFNFFGISGKLKNVQDIISEHVNKKLEDDRKVKEQFKKEYELKGEIKKILENTKKSGVDTKKLINSYNEAFELYEKRNKLSDEIIKELKNKIDYLEDYIKILPGDKESFKKSSNDTSDNYSDGNSVTEESKDN